MPNTALPTDPVLTAIAIAYKNPDQVLIADEVLPRAPVGGTLFSYTLFDDAEKFFRRPGTRVGPRSRVNRVELGGERKQSETEDNAIEIPLSFYDTNAPTPQGAPNVRGMATELATSIVLLEREIQVAELVFNADSYPAGFKETVAGDDQWTDTDSDPVTMLLDGLETALVRPNRLVFGHRAWRVFRRHPKVASLIHGTSGTEGLAKREQIAELLEVQQIVVGSGWVNLAKPGAAPQMVRTWGNHVAALYVDRTAAQAGGLTFGATFEYGARSARVIASDDVGFRGGELVRVGESTRPLVTASRAGYFWEDVVPDA